MSNAILPALSGLAWSVKKVPQWNSRVQRSTGGMELRATYFSLPIWRWTLTYEFLRQTGSNTEFASLAGFFNARQGMYDTFLYSDPSDYLIAPATPMTFGTGTGARTQWQLTRTLGSASAEPVYNLNASPTPVIYDNGTPLVSGYSISGTGLVTFSAAPVLGHTLAWSGAYYWRCRFDQDSAEFDNFASLFWKLGGLSFVSVKGS